MRTRWSAAGGTLLVLAVAGCSGTSNEVAFGGRDFCASAAHHAQPGSARRQDQALRDRAGVGRRAVVAPRRPPDRQRRERQHRQHQGGGV